MSEGGSRIRDGMVDRVGYLLVVYETVSIVEEEVYKQSV